MNKYFLYLPLFFSFSVVAQTCPDYIDDDWENAQYTVDAATQTVVDSEMGLMWKQCPEGLTGANCDQGNLLVVNWQDALNRSAVANAGAGYAGQHDWRLPNITELTSLIAFNCHQPAINETAFPNTVADGAGYYHSSTPRVGLAMTRSVGFQLGSETTSTHAGNTRMVRLVRIN